MSDEQQKDVGTKLAEERTALALKRTVIAAERTLMAWIRTSLSMISFGFTIYKFVQYLHEQAGRVKLYSARNLGLTLVALGTLALILAICDYRNFLKSLDTRSPPSLWSTSLLIALLVALVGVLAFIGYLTRSGPF